MLKPGIKTPSPVPPIGRGKVHGKQMLLQQQGSPLFIARVFAMKLQETARPGLGEGGAN